MQFAGVSVARQFEMGQNENGPVSASNASPALTDNADVGGPRMAQEATIAPQGDSAITQNAKRSGVAT
jgi:hypothetical protein